MLVSKNGSPGTPRRRRIPAAVSTCLRLLHGISLRWGPAGTATFFTIPRPVAKTTVRPPIGHEGVKEIRAVLTQEIFFPQVFRVLWGCWVARGSFTATSDSVLAIGSPAGQSGVHFLPAARGPKQILAPSRRLRAIGAHFRSKRRAVDKQMRHGDGSRTFLTHRRIETQETRLVRSKTGHKQGPNGAQAQSCASEGPGYAHHRLPRAVCVKSAARIGLSTASATCRARNRTAMTTVAVEGPKRPPSSTNFAPQR